jgi:hypothetical protein
LNADPERLNLAMRELWKMRVGRSLGRTLYFVDPEAKDPKKDLCVGIVDDADLAAFLVDGWNHRRSDLIGR